MFISQHDSWHDDLDSRWKSARYELVNFNYHDSQHTNKLKLFLILDNKQWMNNSPVTAKKYYLISFESNSFNRSGQESKSTTASESSHHLYKLSSSVVWIRCIGEAVGTLLRFHRFYTWQCVVRTSATFTWQPEILKLSFKLEMKE